MVKGVPNCLDFNEKTLFCKTWVVGVDEKETLHGQTDTDTTLQVIYKI